VLLLALAVGMGYVSWRAQLVFVASVKHQAAPSAVQALGLDCGAAIFGLLALARARLGRSAVAERALNVACAAGSLVMNVAASSHASARDMLVYAMPAALYAVASDRLIATARQIALTAATPEQDRSGLEILAGAALYLARFVLVMPSTAAGVRRAILAAAPVPERAPILADSVRTNGPAPRPGTKTSELLRVGI
jgi:hypothetical protein